MDANSNLAPHSRPGQTDGFAARADGLSAQEALELVAWLKDEGCESIEVLEGSDHCSVIWTR